MSDEWYGVCCLATIIIGIILFYYWSLEVKKKEEERQAKINRRQEEWGHEICDMLINRKIAIDMNEEMVRLSWGDPATIEQKEILKSGIKTRWIYGVPRRGAKYVWFKNGIVTKIKL